MIVNRRTLLILAACLGITVIVAAIAVAAWNAGEKRAEKRVRVEQAQAAEQAEAARRKQAEVQRQSMIGAMRMLEQAVLSVSNSKRKNNEDQLIVVLIQGMEKVDCSAAPVEFKKAWGDVFYELQKYQTAKKRDGLKKLFALGAGVATGGTTEVIGVMGLMKPGPDADGFTDACHRLHNVCLEWGVLKQ